MTYDAGARPQTCRATGKQTLAATTGSPLPVIPPRWKNLPPATPLIWRWQCRPDSDPMPRRVLIRWAFDPKTVPHVLCWF